MKFLLIQTAFIGDAILTLPMIQELKKKYPESLIDVVSTPISYEIFKNSPYVNKVFPFDKRKKQKSLLELFKFSSLLKKEKYSRIYSPHRSFRTSLLVLLIGIKETYGFSNSSFKWVYNHIVTYRLDRHEVLRNLNLIGLNENISLETKLPVILPENDIKIKISNFIENVKQPLIAIAPGSVWETKKFPKERYIEIINHILSTNKSVILIGGAQDKPLCDYIESRINGTLINSAGRFSIIESIEILKNCDLLISNDSAPTHFGMCANIPVITIYCSTVPDFGFYPFNKKSTCISYNDLNCKPCGIHGHNKCPINTFDCAYKININLIYNEIDKILDIA